MTAVSVASRTLEQLADQANREHRAAVTSASTALEHAILCGEVLIEARDQIEPGLWSSWIAANLAISYGTVGKYMRLAEYQQVIGRSPTTEDAIKRLAALGYQRGSGRDPEYARVVRRLSKSGLDVSAIADLTGTGEYSVRMIVDTQFRHRRLRQQARQRARSKQQIAQARAALKEEEIRRAARLAGRPVSEAYSLIRRAAQHLDAAIASTPTSDELVWRNLKGALAHLHNAESCVGDALRCGAPDG